MDNLVCQAYYNPELITVLNILLIGIQDSEREKKLDEYGYVKHSNLYHLKVPNAFIVRVLLLKVKDFRGRNLESCFVILQSIRIY